LLKNPRTRVHSYIGRVRSIVVHPDACSRIAVGTCETWCVTDICDDAAKNKKKQKSPRRVRFNWSRWKIESALRCCSCEWHSRPVSHARVLARADCFSFLDGPCDRRVHSRHNRSGVGPRDPTQAHTAKKHLDYERCCRYGFVRVERTLVATLTHRPSNGFYGNVTETLSWIRQKRSGSGGRAPTNETIGNRTFFLHFFL